ncbi:alpha/beta fold hydrolase [Olivibacter sp. XZL3]|uniref:alpha/beta fold hydrolase n=1 Tax=Olivibacter sp. XZL3 TaxID=1735116 RepID=UPI0010655DE5|nr:alpha/beta hydrolase [Olivibacter sp. XZL3]
MKHIIFLALFLLTSILVSAKDLYSRAYGDRRNPAIIFVHGGPSGNSTLFESTTAQKLADKGFYVIVYDRRGEGRSIDPSAAFTYTEAFNDLNGILQLYKINKATLIGHSFGGLVATLFTERFPERVNALILAGALVSQQETYDHILSSLKRRNKNNRHNSLLKKISKIEQLDKNSADYRKACYELASLNHYFEMPFPTEQSKELRDNYASSVFYKQNIRNENAPALFYKNETLRNINTKNTLAKLKTQTSIFAIYGKQDGIFSPKQLQDIKNIVTPNNFALIDNCSHYLFVDQQTEFIDRLTNWIQLCSMGIQQRLSK